MAIDGDRLDGPGVNEQRSDGPSDGDNVLEEAA
jgi:hypothetical protein